MQKFIELTEVNEYGKESPVYVNVEQIAAFYPIKGGMQVVFAGQGHVNVKETPDDILYRIKHINLGTIARPMLCRADEPTLKKSES